MIVRPWRVVRVPLAWLAGTALAYALASVAHTQTIIAALGSLGVSITPAERLATTLGDLLGLWRYAVVIGIALALGLPVLAALPRWLLPLPPALRGLLGGALALGVALLAMRLTFSFTPIASARGAGGFALQCLAGGAGGLLCARLLERAPGGGAGP